MMWGAESGAPWRMAPMPDIRAARILRQSGSGARAARRRASDGVCSGLAGADADRFLDGRDEDLAVADAPGLRRFADRLHGPLDEGIGQDDLELHLGQEIDHVLGAPIELRVALLTAETLRLDDGDALEADLLERLLHLVELERLDDRFDLLHAARACAAVRGISNILVTPSPCRFRGVFDHSAYFVCVSRTSFGLFSGIWRVFVQG